MKYTELPDVGHNAWDPAYANAEFIASQRDRLAVDSNPSGNALRLSLGIVTDHSGSNGDHVLPGTGVGGTDHLGRHRVELELAPLVLDRLLQ